MYFGPWEISRLTLWLQKRSERSHKRWRPYSFRTNYSVNSQAFRTSGYPQNLVEKKIPSEIKFAERKSALLQNNNVWKKNLPFVQSYKVAPPLHHPKINFMSKWHLIQSLQTEIYKEPTLISYVLVRSKNLWSRITLYRAQLYVCVWLVNTLTLTAPIGSPIICMWSPADICEQWERNLSFSLAEVRGAGMRDEPLRRSAWEAIEVTFSSQTSSKFGQCKLVNLGIWANEKQRNTTTLYSALTVT